MKKLAALWMASICAISPCFGIAVSAETEEVPYTEEPVYTETAPEGEASPEGTTTTETSTTTDELIMVSGLISDYDYWISAAADRLVFSGYIQATAQMAKLGFVNFVIERSDSPMNGWEIAPYAVLDKTTTNAQIYTDSLQIPVPGGHYYRINFDYYAKEKGILNPGTEYIPATPIIIWVPPSG